MTYYFITDLFNLSKTNSFPFKNNNIYNISDLKKKEIQSQKILNF